MNPLNRKERILRAISHQPVDRPPKGELCVDDEVVRTFFGIEDIHHAHRHEFARKLGMDLICLSPDYPPSQETASLPDPDRVKWLDLDCWARDTDFFPFVLMEGAFGWGVRIWGFEGFVLKVVRNHPDISFLTQQVEQFNRHLARKASGIGAAGIVLADDIAYQNGLILSPEMLRAAFTPSYQRQVEQFKKCGLSVFFHSDGNLNQILEDIAEAGFDGLQCIEEAAGMDLAQVKADFGRRLCLWGNLDPVYLTQPMAEGVVESKVRAVIKAGSPGTGFIFGTSSGLFRWVQTDLVQRAYGEAGKQPA